MKLSSIVIAALGVTCSALEETNQVRALKGGKSGGGSDGGSWGGDKGGKSAGGKKGKSAKGTSSPTISLAPTLYKNSKAKSSEPEFVCPFGDDEEDESTDDYYYYGKSSKGKRRVLKGGKSGSKSKGKSSESPFFLDSFPDGPGSSILIVPADDPTQCAQPSDLEIGGAVIMAECGFSDVEAFKVDRYGRLHASKWSLCIQGDGDDLILGSCDSCSALFEYDEETSFISPMEDSKVVFTAEDGAMTLQPPASRRLGRKGGGKFLFFFFQIFVIFLYVPGVPTASPAPTGSLAPV
mmetsp:Transcript_8679/g.17772  ORF Transcript_8679/g.17772 Transcript_8679/m.17772 type:complete len:294 (-) Transcript_8679:332-1213(-)